MARGRRRSGWQTAARFTGAGAAMTGAVVGGLLLGMALDRWLGTGPWLALIGLVLGAAGGFLELARALRAWQREEERGGPERSDGRDEQPPVGGSGA